MPRTIGWLAVIAVAASIAAYLWFQRERPAPPLPAPPATEAPPPAPAPAPKTEYPLPPSEAAEPLPALGESDAPLRDGLSGIVGDRALGQHAVFDDFVRRVVATVDNLPRRKLSLRMLPVKTVPGPFPVASDGEGLRAAPQNSARYAPYVRLAEAIDAKKVVALYVRFYPLFQEAYRDLGYPDARFNDRLMVAIDDLLAAPEVKAPLRLTQPKVMYEYADPELEARSAGQKIMMRIGNANAARIKEKLRAIRAELSRLAQTVPR